MRNIHNRNRSGGWLFKAVPWVIGIGTVFTIVFVVAQFAFIGWAGYQVVTDPEGTADFIGNIAGSVAGPVADAIKGE